MAFICCLGKILTGNPDPETVREITSDWDDHLIQHPSLVPWEGKGTKQARCWDKMRAVHLGSSAPVCGGTERKHWEDGIISMRGVHIHGVCISCLLPCNKLP